MKEKKGEKMYKTKVILTSVLAIMIATPSMAAVGDTTYGANSNTTGACNIDVLGVSTNNSNANARATFTANTYNCAAGTYLPAGSAWTSDTQYEQSCAQCPENSYCGGDTYTYNANSAQGATACSGTYTLSDPGSTSVNQCYRVCTTSDVAHSATVTGRYYSNESAQSNSCEPATCVTGYRVQGNGPNLTTAIGVSSGTTYAAIDNSGDDMNTNASTYGLTNADINTFVVDYGNNKKLIGHARCSTRSATNPWVGEDNAYVLQSDGLVNSLTDETGQSGAQYCYCHLEGYDNGTTITNLSAPWVFGNVSDDADFCADYCAVNCANYLRLGDTEYLAFRSTVFGVTQSGSLSCVANTINLNWKSEDGSTTLYNEPASCTYDGALTTPTGTPTKRGHTFAGWQFQTPSQQ